jgi:hypothetical protein
MLAVYQALDQAFVNRVSRLLDAMCNNTDPDRAAPLFMQRFRTATDKWNEAKAAIEAGYPESCAQLAVPTDLKRQFA